MLIGLAATFLVFAVLQEYFPWLWRLGWMLFLTCFAALCIDPQLGAGITMISVLFLVLVSTIIAIPLVLSYLMGIVFVVLFCIGLGQIMHP